MSKSGPETKLILKMRKAGIAEYGERLSVTKYHGSAFGEAGASDLLMCLDGVFIACEVKSPEASVHKRATVEASIAHALEYGPTVKQRLYVARILRSGGCAGFVATVEQFMEQLDHAARWVSEGDQCDGHNV